MRQEEISSQICKAKIQLSNAQFQEVDDIMKLFGKWYFPLHKPRNYSRNFLILFKDK